MVKQGDDPEPLRPGWYPAGDSRHQRYYAGRQKGWTDDYILEIDARDPLSPPGPATTTDGMLIVAILIVVVVVTVVTGMLVGVVLL